MTFIRMLLLGTIAVALSLSPENYFDCEKYPSDQYQQIDKTRRECVTENVDGTDFVFCKHWQCGTPQCSEEDQTTWPDGCNACTGMCSSGGKFYPLGSRFVCPDNINICGCYDNGKYYSTYIGINRFALCNASIPENGIWQL